MNTTTSTEEMHIEQGKCGQTVIHDDGTSPDVLYLVADDEIRKSVLFRSIKDIIFVYSFVRNQFRLSR
jgi:hypothetical protein